MRLKRSSKTPSNLLNEKLSRYSTSSALKKMVLDFGYCDPLR
jgi:hypothetical protein